MSDLKVSGYKASEIFDALNKQFAAFTDAEREDRKKKTNGVFELRIRNADNEEAVWTIDLKNTATVYKGPARPKADVTLTMSDQVFADLADGKISGQKAFMTGSLKSRGNIMLATKLDALLNLQRTKAKL